MKPAIMVQSDCSLLLNSSSPFAEEAQRGIKAFSELIKQLGQYEVYELTPLTIWNALSSGFSGQKIWNYLHTYKKSELPLSVEQRLHCWISRYGKLSLKKMNNKAILTGEKELLDEVSQLESVVPLLEEFCNFEGLEGFSILLEHRGLVKQLLARHEYCVLDEVGYQDGESVPFQIKKQTLKNKTFQLRDYQRKAIASFHRDKLGGNGVIVLPCGTGKTITGIGVLASLQCAALILTSSITACEQWKAEMLDKTSLTEEIIGIYGGELREVRPITIATYHILTYRSKKDETYRHMKLFNERDWGLIIYDEVQLLPAPVFRMTASIQATRRLGLTATLIREDGCAPDVYSLVGPKLYDMQWKQAEEEQYIAKVNCFEIRVALAEQYAKEFAKLGKKEQLKLAAINERKLTVVKSLLEKHYNQHILIIGQYIEQLQYIARHLKAPLLTGTTSYEQRNELYSKFRSGQVKVLVVSKIANLAVDLPDASVAIQVSGSFGSRQEEAQRIGRILRPKAQNEAWFYSLVTSGSKETEFAVKRGMFMLEQGYQYQCLIENEVLSKNETFI